MNKECKGNQCCKTKSSNTPGKETNKLKLGATKTLRKTAKEPQEVVDPRKKLNLY